MRSSYYLEPGQTMKNTKISERKLLLMAPRSEYKRFIDYTRESENMAVIALKEDAKLAAARKATYEMSKNWENTNENVKKRREAELLAKRKLEDEEREKFAKEIAKQNAEARAKVVKEARRLLLYRKPQCRLLNGALLTSECFRERDAQIEFEKTLRGIDEERDKEYADIIKKEAKEFEEIERRKIIAKSDKDRAFGVELKKQIEENRKDLERGQMEEYIMGKKDLENISKDLRMIKEIEDEEKSNRRNELKKLVTDAIEEKKKFSIESQKEDEFRDRALKIFERSKKRIKNIEKMKSREEIEAKMRHAEYLGKKFCAASAKKQLDNENELILKAQLEIESRESAAIEAKRQRAFEARMERLKIREESENERRKEEEAIREINAWETLQRLKRVEFNKEFEIKERKRDFEKKISNAKDLKEQMLENEERKILEKKYENDENSAAAIIERTNKKVLEYGQELVNESVGVRPLFPILKTIEKFKIENGLLARKIPCDEKNAHLPYRKAKKRVPVCLAPVPEKEIVYI